MNRTMNEDTAENRDCSNDTDHVKKDKGAYAEPPAGIFQAAP